jgi:site-specific recombinase XerD
VRRFRDNQKQITLKRLHHRGAERIGLFFPKDKELISICKEIGAKFSRTYGCWYIDNRRENLSLLFKVFRGKAWVETGSFFSKEKVAAPIKDRATLAVDLPENRRRELEHFSRYMRARGMSENTDRSYRHAIGVFLTFYGERDMASITNDDVNAFLSDQLYSQGYSRSYQSQFISAIKHFFRERYHKKLDIEELSHPRQDRKLPKVFSKEEIADIIKSTSNMKHRTMLSVQYGMGLRVGELIGLRLKDLDFQRGTVRVFGKGRKARQAFMGKGLSALLKSYVEAYKPKDWLFEGQNGRYSASSVNQVLKKSAKRAGISKPVNSHMLRHSFATHLLESGVDLRYIQELMGHQSSKTTEIYTFVSIKKLRDIENPFDGLDL